MWSKYVGQGHSLPSATKSGWISEFETWKWSQIVLCKLWWL